MSSSSQKGLQYLFLDIEWNQKAGTWDMENREPVQIGAVGTDEDLKVIKTFSRGISLKNAEDLTEETEKLIHMTKEVVAQGRPEKEVLEKLKRTFPSFHYVVVWTMSTYELFQASLERSGISMPKCRALALQDILHTIAMDPKKSLSFETALTEAGIPYVSNYLHYSKHDAQYLYELFRTMYSRYAALTEKETCVVNPRSRIIHSPDCRYAKSGQEEKGARRLLFSGYRPCRICGTEKVWRRFQWKPFYKNTKKDKEPEDLRILPLTDKNIRRICGIFGLKCKIISNVVLITTSAGEWRLNITEDQVTKVFHENYRSGRSGFFKKSKKWSEGFHRQEIRSDNFYDVARYIYYHDRDRVRGKKDRIDFLFEKIKKEAEPCRTIQEK